MNQQQLMDKNAAEDYALYGVNESDIYRRRAKPIIANLARKMKAGTYDKKLAEKAWLYWANDVVRAYAKEFDETLPSVSVRKQLAIMALRYYNEELIQEAAAGIRSVVKRRNPSKKSKQRSRR